MAGLTNQFSLPTGQFVNLASRGQYALPNGVFISEQVVVAHIYAGPATYYSWWLVRQKPT